MNGREAANYIESLRRSSESSGLFLAEKLLGHLGHPERKLKFIHIAGTNGKGSTAAMTASVLSAAGMRTGLFTSPHLIRFNERISIDGDHISDFALSALTEEVAAAAALTDETPGFFEFATALAFLYFLRSGCDIVVLETGLGGRRDPTNAIEDPLAVVITRIGLDHTGILGDTPEQIAFEKAGIIKEGSDVVISAQLPRAEAVLRKVCRTRRAKLYTAGELVPGKHSLAGQSFFYMGEEFDLRLLGENQLENAAACLKTIELLGEKGYEIDIRAVKEGLKNAYIPARFEVLSENPVFILDGGHNPQCAEALTRNIDDYLAGEKISFVLGLMRDKDIKGVVSRLCPKAARFITVKAPGERAIGADELKDLCDEAGTLGEPVETIARENLDEAFRFAFSCPEPVIAFGSMYLAGEILKEARARRSLRPLP